jgi:L-asparagine transporter-like permease
MKNLLSLNKNVVKNTKNEDRKRGYAWYYYFSYWALVFFIFYYLNIVPYNPYFLYLIIIIIIVIQLLYLIFYQVYYRMTDPQNINIIKTPAAWSIIVAWLLIILVIDIIPYLLLKPTTDKNSILFTFILGLVYLMFLKSQSIALGKQYFSKGEKFNDAAHRYSFYQYIFN